MRADSGGVNRVVSTPPMSNSRAMSKSLKRVRAALTASGAEDTTQETPLARTAADAANALGCEIDQIAKSIILQGSESGQVFLFITAGGRQVDLPRASALAQEPLGKADAAAVRSQTGFAIGGVSPIGHVTDTRKWFDKSLMRFDIIWAAAGTPHHVFSMKPQDMLGLSSAEPADFT